MGLNPLEVNVPEVIREMTGGRGADKTIECVGAKPTFDLALECIRAGQYVDCWRFREARRTSHG